MRRWPRVQEQPVRVAASLAAPAARMRREERTPDAAPASLRFLLGLFLPPVPTITKHLRQQAKCRCGVRVPPFWHTGGWP